MGTITVLDANGQPVPINEPLPPGRDVAAASNPVALSNEDSAVLNQIAAVPGTDSAHVAELASTQLLAADPARNVVLIQNVSASAVIGASSLGPAALNAGGTKMAWPLGYVVFQGAAAQRAISVISDTAGTPLTVSAG